MDEREIEKILHQAQLEVRIHPDQAMKQAIKAQSLAEGQGYEEGRSRAMMIQARIAMAQSRNEEAVNLFQQILEQNRRIYDRFMEDQVYLYSALLFIRQGHFEKTLDYVEKMMESSHDSSLVASRMLVCLIALDLNNPRQARAWLDQGLGSLQQAGSYPAELQAEINFLRGRIAADLGDEDLAFTHLEDSLAWFRENSYPLREASLLIALSRLEKSPRKGTDILQKALLLCRSTGNRFHEGEIMIEMGRRYIQEGEYRRGAEYINRGLDITALLSAAVLQKRAHSLLVEAYRHEGRHQEALESAQRAMAIEKSYRTDRCLLRMEKLWQQISSSENQSREEMLEKSFRRMAIISDIGRRITATLDIEQVLGMVYENVNQLMDAALFGIGLYDNRAGTISYELYIDRGESLPGFTLSMDSEDSFSVWSVKHRREILSNNLEEDYDKYISQYISHAPKEAQSIIYLPLMVEEEVVAILTVQSYEKNAYSEEHLTVLRVLSGYMAVALANSSIHRRVSELNKALSQEKKELERAYAQIAHMANHDNLTGLANRRLLAEMMEKYLLRARREKTFLAVLFIDLDDFKPINDQYGHKLGDRVLKVVAERLKESLRDSDLIARVGGDEFVSVLPDLHTVEEARMVAQKIIENVCQPIEAQDMAAHLGVSIGISLYPRDGESTDRLLRNADAAMYRVKQKTKNAICFYGEEVSAPSGGKGKKR